jgi:hypothetical protein
MDWRKIERDVKIQTSGLLQSSLQYLPDSRSSPYDDQPSQSFYRSNNEKEQTLSIGSVSGPSHGGSRGPNNSSRLNVSEVPSQYDLHYQFQPKLENLHSDIADLREIIFKQNEKIRSLDHQVESALSLQSRYDHLIQRFQQIENEQQVTAKHLTGLSREHSEYLVQTKNVSGKIEWLEDLVRTASQDSVSKSAFSQFLESCSEQLKLVHLSTENAKTNSALCLSFLDSFLSALSQLHSDQRVLCSAMLGQATSRSLRQVELGSDERKTLCSRNLQYDYQRSTDVAFCSDEVT